MKPNYVRRYLLMALEFSAYCLMMTLLSYVMVMFIMHAPQENGAPYVLLSISATILAGFHAKRMYRCYRAALEQWRRRKQAPKTFRPWFERITVADPSYRHRFTRYDNAVQDASPELVAIRLRIAERMAREDRERERAERAERERREKARRNRLENIRKSQSTQATSVIQDANNTR